MRISIVLKKTAIKRANLGMQKDIEE